MINKGRLIITTDGAYFLEIPDRRASVDSEGKIVIREDKKLSPINPAAQEMLDGNSSRNN